MLDQWARIAWRPIRALLARASNDPQASSAATSSAQRLSSTSRMWPRFSRGRETGTRASRQRLRRALLDPGVNHVHAANRQRTGLAGFAAVTQPYPGSPISRWRETTLPNGSIFPALITPTPIARDGKVAARFRSGTTSMSTSDHSPRNQNHRIRTASPKGGAVAAPEMEPVHAPSRSR